MEFRLHSIGIQAALSSLSLRRKTDETTLKSRISVADNAVALPLLSRGGARGGVVSNAWLQVDLERDTNRVADILTL